MANKKTLERFWVNLKKNKIIVQTRLVGKAKMYKLNFDNPIIKKFRDFYWETTKQTVHENIENKKITLSN